jgi:hypothetical protein
MRGPRRPLDQAGFCSGMDVTGSIPDACFFSLPKTSLTLSRSGSQMLLLQAATDD